MAVQVELEYAEWITTPHITQKRLKAPGVLSIINLSCVFFADTISNKQVWVNVRLFVCPSLKNIPDYYTVMRCLALPRYLENYSYLVSSSKRKSNFMLVINASKKIFYVWVAVDLYLRVHYRTCSYDDLPLHIVVLWNMLDSALLSRCQCFLVFKRIRTSRLCNLQRIIPTSKLFQKM